MGSFIANSIKIQDSVIYVKGGSSNIVPRDNDWTHYEEQRYLLIDLISGCLELNSTSQLSKKCHEAVGIIKERWQIKFGQRNKDFGGCLSINPYSLYSISRYTKAHKEEVLKNCFDNSHIEDSYKEVRIREAKATQEVYDEGEAFFSEQSTFFIDYISK